MLLLISEVNFSAINCKDGFKLHDKREIYFDQTIKIIWWCC